MANKIIKIGYQTTNLLSNDNLILYSDISMVSDFEAKGATTSRTEPKPEDYYLILATEENYASADSTIKDDGPKNIQTSVELNDGTIRNDCYIALFPNENYPNDLANFYDYKNTSKFKIAKNINVKAIKQSIHNIFTWQPGERILLPEFGNTLHKLLYNGITQYNEDQIIAEIRRCISEYEPRVSLEQVKNVSTIDDTENNTIRIEIVYTIPSLNEEQYAYTYIYHKD